MPSEHKSGIRVMRGDGDGTAIYFGERSGAPFVAFGCRGFSGWQSYPKWMPGGWAFFSPHLHLGRLSQSNGRVWGWRLIVPAKWVDLWRFLR